MGKRRILMLPFVVLAAIFATASVAGAGNSATSTPFQVNPFKFNDTVYSVSCAGVHIVKTGRNPVHTEIERCIAPNYYYSPGTYSLAGKWTSDYHNYILHEPYPVDLTDPNFAISGTLVVTDNGDGTSTWYAVSNYR